MQKRRCLSRSESGTCTLTFDVFAVLIIRSAYRGTPVLMDIARKALKNRRFRFRWSNYRVMAKLDLAKCYRCWAFGPLDQDSKGPDRSKSCLNYDEVGHMHGEDSLR